MCHSASTRVCAHNPQVARRDTPDFLIAPNLWLLNISDFSSADYRSGSVTILCDMWIS